MCRHCEPIKDIKAKYIVHEFMLLSADSINHKMLQHGRKLIRPIVADDFSVKLEGLAYAGNPVVVAESVDDISQKFCRSLREIFYAYNDGINYREEVECPTKQ